MGEDNDYENGENEEKNTDDSYDEEGYQEARKVSYQLYEKFLQKYGEGFEEFTKGAYRDLEGDADSITYNFYLGEARKWIKILEDYDSSSEVQDVYDTYLLPKIIKICEEGLKDIELMGLKLSEEKRKEIVRQSQRLQYNYDESLWKNLFEQYSHHNDLYGQLLFHVALGVITDVKINMGNKLINVRPHLFFMQDSRSGKNRGMEFVESILSELHKVKNINGEIREDIKVEFAKIDNQSDGTMLNRPIMRSRKGILEIEKDEESGEMKIIKGLLEKVHLAWYEEASFLLNPHNKYALEASQMYLTFLEGRPYFKELVQWGGNRFKTEGDFSLVCLSRPIENIKLHIIYSGLLLRMIFLPRILTPEDRRIMDKADSLIGYRSVEEREKYQQDFKNLILSLKKIQIETLSNPLSIKEELIDVFRVELDNKKRYLHELIEGTHLRFEHKKILHSFLAGYSPYFYSFAFQSAIMRGDSNVELGDLEYAYSLIKSTFLHQVKWIEDNVVVVETEEIKWEFRKHILLQLKPEGKVLVKLVRKHLCKEGKMTQPTAGKTLEYFSKSPDDIVEIIGKYVVFK